METTINIKLLNKVLESQRMISIRNLTEGLVTDFHTISKTLVDYQQKGFIRIAQAKGCTSSCTSCSSCSTDTENSFSINDIVISLLYSRPGNNVDK